MDVGVRELKQHLSEYLDRAAAGETIQVTDRGKPKAVLGPLPQKTNIERGIEEGWISPALRDGPPPLPRGFKSHLTIQEVLDEDRGD